jgi:hypothetical protein
LKEFKETINSYPHPAMNILGYQFQGPFSLAAFFNPIGAVYIISDKNNSPIDVGQTGNLKERIPCHERQACWHRNAAENVYVYALPHNDEETRLLIESAIRNRFNFTCGIF